jgi:hypothetical protein
MVQFGIDIKPIVAPPQKDFKPAEVVSVNAANIIQQNNVFNKIDQYYID